MQYTVHDFSVTKSKIFWATIFHESTFMISKTSWVNMKCERTLKRNIKWQKGNLTFFKNWRERELGSVISSSEAAIFDATFRKHCCSSTGVSINVHNSNMLVTISCNYTKGIIVTELRTIYFFNNKWINNSSMKRSLWTLLT